MARVAVDFGTSNTVIARVSETTGAVETVAVPEISTEMRYRVSSGVGEEVVHVIPSLIHYGETQTLIGEQVRSQGLVDHPDTVRWFKRLIGRGVTRTQPTAQGHKSPQAAGQDFLSMVMSYAGPRLDPERDEFTFTAPVESFEYYENWLLTACAQAQIQRVQLMDEPTACILGYQGAAHRDDRFLVFDFGGGTLDVSVVRVDQDPTAKITAIPLGQAGCDIGGMDVDEWLAEDFMTRCRLDTYGRSEFQSLILANAEQAKISLSDPRETEVVLQILDDRTEIPKMLRAHYRRDCPACLHSSPAKLDGPCMGCLLKQHEFAKRVRETIERAIENAAIKAQVRRSDLTRVVVTGGTSLTACVVSLIGEMFGDRVDYARPFDAVVRGACQGRIDAILRHDYALESYVREKGRPEFMPLFSIGTNYPIAPADAKRMYCKGTYEGMRRIGFLIFEVSRMKRTLLNESAMDRAGVFRVLSRVETDFEHICLNAEAPTFISADPPISLERDKQRFLCSFRVDGNRRLLVTVTDALRPEKPLLQDHPVVTLS